MGTSLGHTVTSRFHPFQALSVGDGASVTVTVTVVAAGVTMVERKLEQWSRRRLGSPKAAAPVTAAKQASSRRINGFARALPANAKGKANERMECMVSNQIKRMTKVS